MTITLAHGPRHGTVRARASKSQLQRSLLCAALGEGETLIRAESIPRDAAAMLACLRALGAEIDARSGALRVRPIEETPRGVRMLPCGESGAALRFLLPVAGALGAEAVFLREGRLPERPLAPLTQVLTAHGMRIEDDGAALCCTGRLRAGAYAIDGGTSSQFVTGLLYALPLLDGASTLRVTGPIVSTPYLGMTEAALRSVGVRFEKSGQTYRIPGGQRFAPPPETCVEGDWSGAAAFLCMGALSREGVTVEGLSAASLQGDRAILDLLRRFGAAVETADGAVTVRRGSLLGGVIDASQTPDLVPVLAALAAVSGGETEIVNAARLRGKESDRLCAAARMLSALGADAAETADGLRIRGRESLTGGTADAANDHRIAMAAAVAACRCRADVTLCGAECVEKSYPAFWEDLQCLST